MGVISRHRLHALGYRPIPYIHTEQYVRMYVFLRPQSARFPGFFSRHRDVCHTSMRSLRVHVMLCE